MANVRDALHLEQVPRETLQELLKQSIEADSRSVLGIGPLWDLFRMREGLEVAVFDFLLPLATTPAPLTALILAIFGACLASYADQLGWRLGRIEEAEDLGIPLALRDRELVFKRRSRCPHCIETIRVRYNIPIVSWILLRGRAACCGNAIPRRHLIVEVFGALLLPVLFFAFGPGLAFLATALYATLAGAASLADLDKHILPNRINYALLWIGIAAALTAPANYGFDPFNHGIALPFSLPLATAVFGAIIAWLFLWVFNWICSWIYHQPDALGWGDVKLLVALGAWLGPIGLVAATVIGGTSAVIFSATTRNREFPAGPHLALGGLVVMLPFVQNFLMNMGQTFYLLLRTTAAG